MRQCDAETADPKLGNGGEKIAKLMHQKWEVNRIKVARHEAGVVQQRRKGMTDGIANHSVYTSSAIERVSAIEMGHLLERNLAGRSGLSDGRVCQRTPLPQRQDARGQAGFSHRNSNEVFGTPGQFQQTNAVGNGVRFCRDLYGIGPTMGRRTHTSRQNRRALKVMYGE